MRQERGFTLIEMMIGIGLMALLLSMAVPALQMFSNNARQTGAVNDFVSSMHAARSTAVTINSRVTVCPSFSGLGCAAGSWDQGWIVFTDPNSNQILDVNETIVATGDGIAGVTIASAEFASFVTYRPNGRVMNASVNGSAGQFTVCDGRGSSHAKVMIVDLSGRPRFSEYLIDGSSPSCT